MNGGTDLEYRICPMARAGRKVTGNGFSFACKFSDTHIERTVLCYLHWYLHRCIETEGITTFRYGLEVKSRTGKFSPFPWFAEQYR